VNALTRAFKLVAEEYGPDIARRIEPYIPDYSTVEEVLDAARNLVGSGKKNVAPAVIKRRSGTPAAAAEDVFQEARKPSKGAPSYAVWRKANPDNGRLLDLSKLHTVPPVDQHDLPRYKPARGASARIVDALADPSVKRGINETVERGIEGGGLQWYNTEPIRERMLGLLGHDAGSSDYARLMGVVAATSPRSKVTDNIRTASYYNYLLKNGLDVPDTPAPKYGSIAQNNHRDNVRRLLDLGGWDVFRNPKPASFSANLRGNQTPATIDTHNFRLPGILSGGPRFLETSISEVVDDYDTAFRRLRNQYADLPDDVINASIAPRAKGGARVSYKPRDWVNEGHITLDEMLGDPASWTAKPRDNEYGYYEKWQQDQAANMGISPAQYQASMWLGGGDTTGLGSAAEPFAATLEARVRYTADRLGLDPEKVLDMLLKGQIPLLRDGGSVSLESLSARYRD